MPLPLRIAIIAYISYLAIALLIVTPALNVLPHWYVKETYGRQLETDWVLFNPFTVSLEVRQAELTEQNGERFVGLSAAAVNLSMESLWRQGWVLDIVKVRDLYIKVIRKTDSEFNFSDLLPKDPDPAPAKTDDNGLPGVTIRDLDIQSESLVFTDQVRKTPFTSRWNDLQMRVLELSTVMEEGRPYIVDVSGEEGGNIHWEGTISIPNGHSDGHLTLTNLSMHAIWQVAEPWLAFEIAQGRIAAQGEYQLDWNDALRYQVTAGEVELTGIDIAPKSPDQLPDTALDPQALTVTGITLQSTTQEATIDTLSIDGLAITTWLNGTTVSLETLFVGEAPEDPATDTARDDDNSSGWSALLNTLKLVNSSLQWRSEYTDPELLKVQPIEAKVEHISWPLAGDTRLALDLTINEQANVAIDGTLALADGDGKFDYTLDGLPLTWFNPNLPAALKAVFTGGEVEVDGQVSLAAFSPIQVALEGQIEDFSVRREQEETVLTNWDSVRIEGLSVDMEQRDLVLEKLAINSYVGRIHIAKDGTINASNVWQEEEGESTKAETEDQGSEKTWSFNIPAVQVTDSQIDFMDESLPIAFRTVISELNGEILGISSDPDAAAKIAFKGSVDSYSPVVLSGEFNPRGTPAELDLDLTFDGLDLASFTPYAGTYAGYAIDRGLLDLHLHYILADNQLKAENDIRIEQFKLGDRVDSDKAIDAPLKLAVSLLTDANGVIDMKVPLEGDVSEPGFELGGLITQAIINVITKVATAPFTLLAGLVDSEEDLQKLTFASGSADLSNATTAKLNQLATALAQRPDLSLVITGYLNPSADREHLQQDMLQAQLLQAGLTTEELDRKGPAWQKAIGKRFKALHGGPVQDPEPTATEKYALVVKSVEVDDAQLIELAEQRAVTVKSFLVNEAGMEANRAVIGKSTLDDAAQSFSGVELSLGN